jgi:glutathione S-transferase
MKVHLDPISTTSRPVLLFLAEHDVPADVVVVSLFEQAHLAPQYAALNPNKCVPTLEDGDFVLAESSAILKYLADKIGSPAYPTELKARARVNEAMDWLSTGFYRDFGYGVVYQQAFPHCRFENALTQAQVVARSEERAATWFDVLNAHRLKDRKFLCGTDVTIADYLGAAYVSIADWIGYDLGRYPNVVRWLNHMRQRPSWQETHGPWNALTASMRPQVLKSA